MLRKYAPWLALAPLLAFVNGCSDDSTLSPLSTSRAIYSGPDVTLQNASMTVTVHAAPFGLSIVDAAGDPILTTLDQVPGVAGDDVDAYGPLGATKRIDTIGPQKLFIEGYDHIEPTDSKWHHGSSVAALSATPSSASVDLFDPADEATTIHVDIAIDGPELDLHATADDAALNLFGQSFTLPADEHFFALGERNSTVDHRGAHYECWVEEGGIPQGEKAPPGPENPAPNGPGMTHIPIPFFLSTKGYGLWIDTTYRTGFSFGAEDDRYSRIYAEGGQLDYRIFTNPNPKDSIARYTELTGRARLPAPWVFGPRRRTDHGVMVGDMLEIEAFRAKNVPTTMADDTTHFLPIGTQVGQESELAAWTSYVHSLGFKAIAYYNPYVSVTDSRTTDLVSYGEAHNLFVKTDDGKEFDTLVISAGIQTVATLDLTNPETVTWYWSLLDEALALGYDGWMLDFGEYIPPNAKMHDGRSGFEAHNAFPVDYDKAVAEHLRDVRGDDFMYYARAGYTGSQAWAPVIWSGDPAASYDPEKGLPAQVRAGVNAGMSGYPFWGSDISGYSCFADPPTDKDLYIRWAQFGALSPDMHDENACAQAPAGAPPKWTLWSDDETTQIYGQFALLHTRLLPYTYAAAAEAVATGTPIMRHPFLENPTDPNAASVEFEYYFGPALYVAPMVVRDATTRTLWLPQGTWFDWWTLAAVEGGATITRDVPLSELPLWIRSGTIVPMLDPSVQTLMPGPVPGIVTPDDVRDVLDARVAVSASAPRAQASLYAGDVLEATLGAGAIALPAGFSEAADDDALASCDACGRVDPIPGGGSRVRLTGSVAIDEVLHAGALRLHHNSQSATRLRWEILVAP